MKTEKTALSEALDREEELQAEVLALRTDVATLLAHLGHDAGGANARTILLCGQSLLDSQGVLLEAQQMELRDALLLKVSPEVLASMLARRLGTRVTLRAKELAEGTCLEPRHELFRASESVCSELLDMVKAQARCYARCDLDKTRVPVAVELPLHQLAQRPAPEMLSFVRRDGTKQEAGQG